ncbi:unnamed protein product [Rotaria socialis]|uniref:Protein TEX261 n=1 Tax=Rotaria socialis TaxID=392032 RepID=A0A820R3Q9_9BILA|nr:unnamed protein product [Rotaria socialis]CAF3372536.1 unnamed protein product [Rotaria socialis]CAF3378341.1 unnamed protein product [Rotaria socialis]CAF4247337.1 unnamed protein product [Rotaria socialis]CAF4430555.1 unnamed protein product [Rotaria socialis]
MWFMYALSWIAFIIIAICLTISVAAGMYYVAELIEEYTTVAKRFIHFILITVTVLNILLLVLETQFTWTLCSIGVLSNIMYFFILGDFPFIGFLSPAFLFSMVLLIIHHYFAFSFFNNYYYPFPEILAYFTIFVWIVPFCFVLSLSANDYVLPQYADTQRDRYNDDTIINSGGDVVTNYFKKRAKKVGLLAFMRSVQESILPTRNKKF